MKKNTTFLSEHLEITSAKFSKKSIFDNSDRGIVTIVAPGFEIIV